MTRLLIAHQYEARTAAPRRPSVGKPSGLSLGGLIPAGITLAIVLYLALRGGGYEGVVHGGVGVAAWWLVGAGLLFGLLNMRGTGHAERMLVAALIAMLVWTVIALLWTGSIERTMDEVVRVATLLGVALLLVLTPGRRPDRLIAAIGLAGAIVAAIALLSRFQPGFFAVDSAVREALPVTISRLAFPLDYWNALALLIAIALPPLLAVSASARSRIGAALAAAAVPAMALAAYYSLSRSGLGALLIAVAVLFLLHPRRATLAASTAAPAAATGILIWAAERRGALADGLDGPLASSQGDSMMLIVLVVVAAVGLLRWGSWEAGERFSLPRLEVTRGQAAGIGGGLAVAALLAALALGFGGTVSDRWEEFKDPSFAQQGSARLTSAGGRGRYQWWQEAIDAGLDKPLLGIGPGTYEYYWNQHGTIESTIHDAHSLYLESFAELGLPGLLIVLTIVGGVLGGGTRVTLAAAGRERAMLAAAVAGCAAFAVGAGVDWSWETTALPVAFLALAAALSRAASGPARPNRPSGPATRGAVAGGCACLVVGLLILIPVSSADSLRASERHFRADELQAALDDAERAERLAPWASAPLLQQALVLERAGDLGVAAETAKVAVDRDDLNWQPWLILARIEAARGKLAEARRDFARARDLNPRSELLRDGTVEPG